MYDAIFTHSLPFDRCMSCRLLFFQSPAWAGGGCIAVIAGECRSSLMLTRLWKGTSWE
jgi:hypothetical protein